MPDKHEPHCQLLDPEEPGCECTCTQGVTFIEQLRQELIDEGHASKMLLDYIDDRIQAAVSNRLVEGFADVEEHIMEGVETAIARANQGVKSECSDQ